MKMNIFKWLKRVFTGKRIKKTHTALNLHQIKRKEEFQGFCPFCNKLVTIETEEDMLELKAVCKECGSILFYLDKLRTPPLERNIDELKAIRKKLENRNDKLS